MEKYTATAKAKAKARDDAKAKTRDDAKAKKEPSVRVKAEPHTKAKSCKPTATILKRPAAVPWITKKPPLPRKGHGPVDYKGGRIYTSVVRSTFRVIRERKKYETERSQKWAGKTPDKKSWDAALKSIDEFEGWKNRRKSRRNSDGWYHSACALHLGPHWWLLPGCCLGLDDESMVCDVL